MSTRLQEEVGLESVESEYVGIHLTSDRNREQQLHKRGVCTNCPLPILEIKRSTDGRLGTISRCEDCVTLFVWHSKHFDELEKE
ncbi:hypothetical protein CAEBREN_20350 [Caenorhabditis brenneri]|uniref:Uncharacterized protein n=1 Tax=Caenorhabditis brenneri TaxID=135651 RepID=G0NSS6_CAEBE|nr:hypothetical protein CAEBREN_20350 [Caenorhabditis brenneri]